MTGTPLAENAKSAAKIITESLRFNSEGKAELVLLLGILEGVAEGKAPPEPSCMVNLLLTCMQTHNVEIPTDAARLIGKEFCTGQPVNPRISR